MPHTYSPQAHARSAKSALANALRLVEPVCANEPDEDVCSLVDRTIGELAYAIEALKRTRAAAQADQALIRARVPARAL